MSVLGPESALAVESAFKLFFGNDLDAQLLGLGQLASRVLPSNHKCGLFGDTRCSLSAVADDCFFDLLASEVFQTAGGHDGHPSELAAFIGGGS